MPLKAKYFTLILRLWFSLLVPTSGCQHKASSSSSYSLQRYPKNIGSSMKHMRMHVIGLFQVLHLFCNLLYTKTSPQTCFFQAILYPVESRIIFPVTYSESLDSSLNPLLILYPTSHLPENPLGSILKIFPECNLLNYLYCCYFVHTTTTTHLHSCNTFSTSLLASTPFHPPHLRTPFESFFSMWHSEFWF